VKTYNKFLMMLAALRRADAISTCIDLAGDIEHEIGTVPGNKFEQSVTEVSAFCMAI